MKLIDKLISPQKVLLIWQVFDDSLNQPAGTRFVVGEILNNADGAKLKYYDNPDVKSAISKGFSGLTAYPYEANKEFNSNLIDILSNRLPPSSRTDYNDFLKGFRISPDASVDTLSLLAYTTGKLAGDGFSFVHTFESATPPFDFTFEIAGFRYYEGMMINPIESLQDAEVSFLEDNTNEHDRDAIAVLSDGKKLGYVPHGINQVLKGLISRYQVSAFVTKINGTRERPTVLVYTSVN